MRATLLFVCLSLFIFLHPSSARAQEWDSSGWVLLGERTIDGHREHSASIDVSTRGRYAKIMIVVDRHEARLTDFAVAFARGDQWHPGVDKSFRHGERSLGLDLPGNWYSGGDRDVTRVDFRYRDADDAHVQIWAKPAIVRKAPVWESKGWELLGERELSGYGDRERGGTIDVGRQEGRFSKMTVVVLDDDLEITDFNVNFDHGDRWRPEIKHYFRENQATRAFDMPENAWGHDARFIKSIDFKYRNVSDGGRARIQVYGLRDEHRREWNSDGWTMLGEREVRGHGREVKDRIEVGRGEGRFSQMTLVVLDADLEIIALSIAFSHGEPWRPDLRHEFREAPSATTIDFPASDHGNEERSIRWIDFTYRNLPGEGHARVQVWAR